DAQLWASLLAQARAGRMSRQPGQRIDSLNAIREALKLPTPQGHSLDELRTEAIAALCLPDIQVEDMLPGLPPGQTAVAFDPAFKLYARGDEQGSVAICRVSDDSERFRLKVGGVVSPHGGLSFSPDGRFLFCRYHVGDERPGRCWNVTGREPRFV